MRKSSRETKKTEVFSFPEASSSIVADSDDEDFGMDSSQSITKRANKMTKEPTLFDKYKSGGNKAVEIIDVVSSNRNLTQDVTRWTNSYKANKVAAMVELVNFILMSAGAKKKWIASDVDLEALEPEELDILLSAMMKTMSESEDSKLYPLSEKAKSKAARTFRDKYQAYWATWTERVLALPRDNLSSSSASRRADGQDILLTVIDQLVALSSMAVVNVRDAVTEAALCVARGVLDSCAALKVEAETARRQINAEESGKSKAAAKQNPKYQFCLQQEAKAKKDLATQWELSEKVFNSVFVHRVKDFHEEVRLTATRHLLDFVRADPQHPVRVDALKYLGWGCGDYASAVRLESIRAIHELVQNAEAIPYLATFVQHFSDRFIQIASSDIDDSVALAMIEAMRSMQRNCLLDSLPQDKLDGVDVIVFDPAAPIRVRQEALAFIMDHTEGFEDEDNADSLEGALDLLELERDSNGAGAAKSKKRSSKGGSATKADQARALARRQRTAQQLETLTEFAEMHLGALVERSYMLTDACLALKKYGMLYNWSTIIALLLRESDELISSALRPQQAAILLRMFVHAAIDLTARRRRLLEASSLSATDKQMLECWEALHEALHTHMPTLLTRFKDNEENLVELVDLLPCCEFNSEDRALKALLKVVLELFGSTRRESVLSSLVATVCGWMRGGGTVAGTVENAVQNLVVANWQAIAENTVLLQGIVDRRDDDSAAASESSSRKVSKRRSGAAAAQAEKEDVLLALQSALTPFKLFWANLDCRSFLEQDPSQLADELTTLAELLPSFSDGESLSDALCEACTASAGAAAGVMHSAVLWAYKDVLDLGRDMAAKSQQAVSKVSKAKAKKGGASSQDSMDVDDSVTETPDNAAHKVEAKMERGISIAVDGVVALREKLVDVLLAWISAEPAASSSGDSQSTGSRSVYGSSSARVMRALQIEAFRLISDLRNFFPVRESQYKYIDRLAYKPSQEIVVGLRNVFDREGGRIKAELLGLNQDDAEGERAARELSRTLIEGLLEPLSSSLCYDVEHLNRKQAAAVIYYLLDSNSLIEEKVKSFMRTLKEANFVKYLEIQLIALRDLFTDVVAKPMDLRAQAEEAEDEDFDFAESERAVADGYTRVELLARKLAQSMGIAKFKDEQLQSLVGFFKATIDSAVESLSRAGFVGCLSSYIKFLPPQSQRAVAEHLEVALEGNDALIDEIDAQRAHGVEESFHSHTAGIVRFVEFIDLIMGRGKPKAPRRKSTTSAHTANPSTDRSRIDAQGGARQGARASKQDQQQLAMSSQVLQEEDLALISGGRYHREAASASQRETKTSKPKAAKKAPVAKVAKAKKSAPVPVKGARQSSRASAKSRSSKSYAEDSSEEEGEEESEEEENLEDEGEEGNGAEEEEGEYAGISQVQGRGRKQSFNSRLASQTQTQAHTEAQPQSQSQATVRGGPKRGPASVPSASAAAVRPAIVLGLDIEDIDESSAEPDLRRTSSNRSQSQSRGRSAEGIQETQDSIEEDDSREQEEEEDAEEEAPARSNSRKRPRPSAAQESEQSAGGRSSRSRGSVDSVAGDSFAELDSIPSRRRLR